MSYRRIASLTVAFMVIAASAWAVNPLLEEIENAFVELAEQVRPVVVKVDAERAFPERSGLNIQGLEELFRMFGQPGPNTPDTLRDVLPGPMMPQSRVSASGFIFDKEGHIVTNNHVVAEAEKIEVRLWNGDTHTARVVGRDPQTDIAVIKIDTTLDLPVATLGQSESLRVGQFAFAVGSPLNLDGSLSFGHVTALGREARDVPLPDIRFYNFIQTDAAINLGNSGGPLCNIRGEVIGINVAIVYAADALGFAIPIDRAKRVIPILIAEGKVIRGYLGVIIENARDFVLADDLPDAKGAYVREVAPDSPASKAGIQVYDVIRSVNDDPILDVPQLQQRIGDMKPGDIAMLDIWRDGRAVLVPVTLEEFPEEGVSTVVQRKTVLGLDVDTLTDERIEALRFEPEASGVIVMGVEPGSPAADSGLQPRDVILEVAKKEVKTPDEFHRIVRENAIPGKALLLRVRRPGAEMPLLLTLLVPEEGIDVE